MRQYLQGIDWSLLVPILILYGIGLVTMYPINEFEGALFSKQLLFVTLSIVTIVVTSYFSYSALRGPLLPLVLYFFAVLVLVSLLFFAPTINGAHSWFVVGPFNVQPVDFVKIILIFILARYFATRHIHIRHIRNVIISLLLTGILAALVFVQPDFGSSAVLLGIWFFMILVSGVSKKHLFGLIIIGFAFSAVSWQFLPTYQQDRISSFLDPLANLETTGYNAYQSRVAVGSGELLGKGVGEGTQSKLQFLPLYESDFIFAAFAEEWGFIGVTLLFLLFGIILTQLLYIAYRGRTNFETLFVTGAAGLIFSHFILHIGVNTGVLPVTGITLPFVSYGGSHLVASAFLIGIVMSMAKRCRLIRVDKTRIIRE